MSRLRGPIIALAAATGAVLVCAIAALAFAPYVYAELWPWLERHKITDPAPAKIVKGRMVDDYFAVQDLGAGAYAIGEPRYYQKNYIYLIVGEQRALLFDSGSGTRDVSGVVSALTRLPVTVMVSHLHFDHFGGIRGFRHVAMVDLPQTRADVSRGRFRPSRYEFLGMPDGLSAPSTQVAEWVKPGEKIELGGRSITVLSTPGHTPSSVSLYDPAAGRAFTGDFLYPSTLYAFLPGASLSAYARTARALLATLPSDTVLWGAHCCRADGGTAAPWLTMGDLRDLDTALARIAAGKAKSKGFYPRIFPVNGQMTLAAGFPWTNR